MCGKSTERYDGPELTELGSVASITQLNKGSLGDDADCPGVALAGSAPACQ